MCGYVPVVVFVLVVGVAVTVVFETYPSQWSM